MQLISTIHRRIFIVKLASPFLPFFASLWTLFGHHFIGVKYEHKQTAIGAGIRRFRLNLRRFKEDYFALLYLAEKFQQPMEKLASHVAFGGNDYGLDAFWIDRDLRNLYLYQFKWSEDQTLFRSSLKRLISSGMDRIFGNPYQDPTVNKFIIELKTALDENQGIIDHVYFHFVFNGDTEKAEQSAVLDSLGEELENKKYMLDQYFGRNVQFALQYSSNRGGRTDLTPTKRTREYEISFEDSLSTTCAAGEQLHVGFIHLYDLYRMHKEMGSRLFSRNIRFGLSPEKSPNVAIRHALERTVLHGEDSPSVFVFNHNGVTLAAEKVHFEDGRCMITEPRILNGAQTITTLVKFLEKNQNNPALEANKSKMNQIQVLAKIITQANEDFIVNVTICNNRQNPVEPWHLRANDSIQLRLQDKFADDLGIFYQRQEGAFKSYTESELKEEWGIEYQPKAIEIKPLAQTFLASQGEIDKMSRLPEVFENENIYDQTFREGYLHSNTRRILLAYKVHFHLRRLVQEIVDQGPSRYEYLHRARNLVWAVLIQAVLNNDHLSQWLTDYGETLVMEANYSDILKGLASSKIRLVIKDGLSDERSKQILAEGNPSILRTKATYQRCMEAAFDRYRWTKRPL